MGRQSIGGRREAASKKNKKTGCLDIQIWNAFALFVLDETAFD